MSHVVPDRLIERLTTASVGTEVPDSPCRRNRAPAHLKLIMHVRESPKPTVLSLVLAFSRSFYARLVDWSYSSL